MRDIDPSHPDDQRRLLLQRWLWGAAILVSLVSLFVSQRAIGLLLNTGLLALATMAVALPVGLVVGLLLERTDLRWRTLADMLVVALLFMPLYLTVAGWEAGLGRQGWLVTILAPYSNWAPLIGWRGAIWGHSLHALPWVIGIVRVGLGRVPSENEELALLEGSSWQVIRRVTMHHLWPFLAAAAAWAAVTVAVEITVTDVYQIRTFAEELYLGYVQGESTWEVQLRLLPSMFVVVTLSLLSLTTVERLVPTSRFATTRRPHRWSLGRWRTVISVMVLGGLCLAFVIPIANLLFHAGIRVTETAGQRERHWSLSKCVAIIAESPWRFRREFAWSLLLAQCSSLTCLAISIPWAITSRRAGWRQLLSFVLVAGMMALPGPVLAIGIIGLLNQPQSSWAIWLYDQTIVAPWIALAVRSLPLVYLLVWMSIRTIPEQLWESARQEGASRWQIVTRLVWPQIIPTVLLAWLVGMALSLGELSASILVMPPGVTTISLRIFSLVHYGVEDQLAGLCLVTVALFVGISAAASYLWLPSHEHGHD